jgi:hypothetical protein
VFSFDDASISSNRVNEVDLPSVWLRIVTGLARRCTLICGATSSSILNAEQLASFFVACGLEAVPRFAVVKVQDARELLADRRPFRARECVARTTGTG